MPQDRADDWVQRLSSPDEKTKNEAITELRRVLERSLKRTLTDRYGTQLPIDDVIQDATLRILASLDQFAGKSRFLTWAITVATRIGLTELRRSRYKDVSLPENADDLLGSDVSDSPASVEDQRQRSALLRQLDELIANELTEKQRVAIRATLDGLPVNEIAARLNSNRNAVYKLIHDARTRLRDGFSKAGIKADEIASVFG